MKQNNTKAIICGLVAVGSWSTVATAFKIALSQLSVFEMLFIACATALAISCVWLSFTRSWKDLKTVNPTTLAGFAVLGLIMPVTYYSVLFTAYDKLPAQFAQPINYTWPIFLALILSMLNHKKIPVNKQIGMLVSFSGVVAISVFGGKVSTLNVNAIGFGLSFLSSVLWALYWILNDRYKNKVSQKAALFLTFFFGMIYLIIGSFWLPLNITLSKALFSGIYIGSFEIGIPFICFGYALRKCSNPLLINQMCYLSPFLSLFLIANVLHEKIQPVTYIGLLLIVGGLVYNEFIADHHKEKILERVS